MTAGSPGSSDAGQRPHVVVVGGGFAGIECVKALRRAPVRVTIIDCQNHHLFQPLLYQVATAALSPANIAAPIREVFADDPNVHVILDSVVDVDPVEVRLRLERGRELEADYLVVAAGLRPDYFGHEAWRRHAPPLKTIDDAIEIRRRFLLAFERSERSANDEAGERNLTFVVIGGGPTGVEMAGALAELSRKTIRSEFRTIDPATARIILVESDDRVLRAFHADSSRRAQADLRRLGVELLLETRVEDVDADGVTLSNGRRIESRNVIWAAGVGGSELAEQLDAPLTGDGRVRVTGELALPDCPNVFVVGDLACVENPKTDKEVPGVAPAAIQMGRFVGRLIRRESAARLAGRTAPERGTFRYLDKGTLATIGRNKAVAEVFGRRFGGRLAFLLWAGVHIYFLIGYRNRILTMLQWVWHYLLYDRSARLITGLAQCPTSRDDESSAGG